MCPTVSTPGNSIFHIIFFQYRCLFFLFQRAWGQGMVDSYQFVFLRQQKVYWACNHQISVLLYQINSKYRNVHRKNEIQLCGVLYVFWVWNQNGGHVFWLFFKIAHAQPYHSKGLGESFPSMWLNVGLCWKITKIRSTLVLGSYPKQV